MNHLCLVTLKYKVRQGLEGWDIRQPLMICSIGRVKITPVAIRKIKFYMFQTEDRSLKHVVFMRPSPRMIHTSTLKLHNTEGDSTHLSIKVPDCLWWCRGVCEGHPLNARCGRDWTKSLSQLIPPRHFADVRSVSRSIPASKTGGRKECGARAPRELHHITKVEGGVIFSH
jgi:hypothetical protein